MDLESKLADVFLINTADGNPFAGKKHGCFSSPADYIHAVSLAPCYCNRVEETVTAASLLAANGVAISCLLYTTDAADDPCRVDLCDLRLLNKKNTQPYTMVYPLHLHESDVQYRIPT